MPKLPRRRSHSRNVQISLQRLRLLDKAVDHSNESSTESDEEEMRTNEDSFDMSKNFNDQITLNDISDVFEICKNNCSYKGQVAVRPFFIPQYFSKTFIW